MLTRTRLLTLGLGALAINAAACVLTTTTDGVGGFGGNGTTSSATSGSTTSSTTSTTSSSSSTTSSSTGGGCTDPAGTGKAESACDSHGFPAVCSSDQLPPIATATCHKGFSLYTSGSWEELETCLGNIPLTTDDLCTDPTASNHVKDCLTTMYSHACANSAADQGCDMVNAACNQGVAFDVAHCKSDLLPFSSTGVNAYIDCINAHPNDACDTLHKPASTPSRRSEPRAIELIEPEDARTTRATNRRAPSDHDAGALRAFVAPPRLVAEHAGHAHTAAHLPSRSPARAV